MKNWKTTLGAVGAALVIVGDTLMSLTDDNPNTNPDIKMILINAGLIYAAWAAKDADNDDGPGKAKATP